MVSTEPGAIVPSISRYSASHGKVALFSGLLQTPRGGPCRGNRAAVGHPSSLQQYFDVGSQESRSLPDGLAGPPQAGNDLGWATGPPRKVTAAYWLLKINLLFFNKADFPQSVFPNWEKHPGIWPETLEGLL